MHFRPLLPRCVDNEYCIRPAHSPVQTNFLVGAVKRSFPARTSGWAQEAIPGSLYPSLTHSESHCIWQSQWRGFSPKALKKKKKKKNSSDVCACLISTNTDRQEDRTRERGTHMHHTCILTMFDGPSSHTLFIFFTEVHMICDTYLHH